MITAGAPPTARRGEPGSLRAVVLAIAVHGAFFALIVFGVTWQSRAPMPVQAEVWDRIPTPNPRLDKALTTPIEREAPPEKPLELKTPPAIEKKPEEAKPAPPKPDPEIAEKLERQKREKEKAEKAKADRLKAAEAKKRQEDEARKKAEAEKKRRDEEAARQREAAETARRTEFEGWVAKIQARIRSRSNVPDTVRGNPEVHVLVRILPGGDVLDITITKRSGNPAYDSAIERGIRSASPLPVPPANSELFPRFRELNLIIKHER